MFSTSILTILSFLILIWVDSAFDMDGTILNLSCNRFRISYHVTGNSIAVVKDASVSFADTYPGLNVRDPRSKLDACLPPAPRLY